MSHDPLGGGEKRAAQGPLPGGSPAPQRLIESAAVRVVLHPPSAQPLELPAAELAVAVLLGAGRAEIALRGATAHAGRALGTPEPDPASRAPPLIARAGGVHLFPAGTGALLRQLEPVEVLIVAASEAHVRSVALRVAGTRAWRFQPLLDVIDAAISALAREMRRALLSDPIVEPGYLEVLADAMLARLTCRLLVDPPETPSGETLAPAVLRKVLAHIDDHLNEELRVEALADLSGYSRSHFTRAFQHATGEPPQRYVLMRRLCRARDLIAEDRASLGAIAARVGFSSQAHMSRAFRDALGLTPKAYRAAFRRADR